MARYLALLRGINVGGRNKLAMSDLRALAAGLGHEDVATYIQSGNLVFASDRTTADAAEALAGELEREIAAQLSRSAAQVTGTARNWATVTRLMTMLDGTGAG